MNLFETMYSEYLELKQNGQTHSNRQQDSDDSQLRQLSEENELLKLQLRQVQLELEAIYRKAHELEQQRLQNEQELKLLRESQPGTKQAPKPEPSKPQQDVVTASQQSITVQQPSVETKAPPSKDNQLEGIQALGLSQLQQIIEDSGLFDREWYVKEYPDVSPGGINPVIHFLVYGAKGLRDPSPEFSTRQYLKQHPELGGTEINPFIHYLLSR